eukprot:TRINITY_DN8863_c0_g1_i4.p1 TRINITY_DN8863_c0_g1~~TRINITY_DN8863_c0_g1_i4.p1  ORF type:complete len:261 (+),score=53.06 TRINITY_DN8863_c0_g1_i4:60-842(+)
MDRTLVFALIIFVVLLLGFFSVSVDVESNPNTEPKRSFDGIPLKTSQPTDPSEPWIEQVSWEPRIFIYHNILTREQCDFIVSIAEADISRSMVVTNGEAEHSEYRSSSGVFLGERYMKKYPLLRNLERRIAEWTHLPRNQGEVFYLIRYGPGEQYKPHHDFFDPATASNHIGDSGNRIATVLFYLHTPDEGGETLFPETKTGPMEVKARAGDAVLFWEAVVSTQSTFFFFFFFFFFCKKEFFFFKNFSHFFYFHENRGSG